MCNYRRVYKINRLITEKCKFEKIYRITHIPFSCLVYLPSPRLEGLALYTHLFLHSGAANAMVGVHIVLKPVNHCLDCLLRSAMSTQGNH